MKHDDITGETVAELWHKGAALVSLIATVSGLGIAVTAAAGYFWHKWAANEHKKELDRLNKER